MTDLFEGTAEDMLRALAASGQKLRERQKDYFTKGRTREQLIASKEAEREFDKILAPILERMKKGSMQ